MRANGTPSQLNALTHDRTQHHTVSHDLCDGQQHIISHFSLCRIEDTPSFQWLSLTEPNIDQEKKKGISSMKDLPPLWE